MELISAHQAPEVLFLQGQIRAQQDLPRRHFRFKPRPTIERLYQKKSGRGKSVELLPPSLEVEWRLPPKKTKRNGSNKLIEMEQGKFNVG